MREEHRVNVREEVDVRDHIETYIYVYGCPKHRKQLDRELLILKQKKQINKFIYLFLINNFKKH